MVPDSRAGGALTRRWMVYLLVALLTGVIVVLRLQARRVTPASDALVVAGAALGSPLQAQLDAATRYVVEVSRGDDSRDSLVRDRVRVVAGGGRASGAIALDPPRAGRDRVVRGRARRAVGEFQLPDGGAVRVEVGLDFPTDPAHTDSIFIARTPQSGDLSSSFSLMLLGGFALVLLVAIAGLVGRTFIERNAT